MADKPDQVFRPQHYARFTIDPITFCIANGLSADVSFAIKYLCRFPYKNGKQDVEKARRMCDMILERLDREARIAAGEAPSEVWKDML